jgi:hypothetical protein
MHDAKYFFKAVREGDVVTFATNEENERHSWVQALYRATGQSHKPTPPITATTKPLLGATGAGQKDQMGKYLRLKRLEDMSSLTSMYSFIQMYTQIYVC